ncbi:MAG: LamG-like jellyroll fold domain-containing protein [Bacteroidota bacterium]
MKTLFCVGIITFCCSFKIFSQTTVSAVVPATHALNVASTATIQVTFSDSMLESSFNDTISFIVSGRTSGRHRGTIVLSNGNTIATFTPTVSFSKGEIVTVDLTSNLKEIGNAAIMPFVYSFTVQSERASETYIPGVGYTVGDAPFSVYVSDIDSDGDGDIIVANSLADSISVLKNNGNGTFASKTDYGTGIKPEGVFVYDMDGDGDNDIVVMNEGKIPIASNPSSISLFKNNGDGTFAAKTDIAVAEMDNPNSIMVGDFDGDADGDLAVVNSNANTISIYKNNGDASFASKVDYVTESFSYAIHAGDVDNDGDLDLAVTSQFTNSVFIFKNNGNGTFAPKTPYGTGTSPISVFISDIDADGDGDLAIANSGSDSVSILKNNGDGTFAAKTDYAAGGTPYSVIVYDADGDGDGDIVVANGSAGTVSLLKNNGDATFATKVDYTTGANPLSLFVSDLNSDGVGDIVTANGVEDKVYVVLGQEASSPSVTTDSVSGVFATAATLNGTVNANNASTTVQFLYGTVSGTYTDSVTATQSPVIGTSNTSVSKSLTGLTANTTYYFVVAASNTNGYVRGSELSFTTVNADSSSGNYALQFDGNDIVSSTLVTTESNNLTMEGWVKWDGGTDVNQLIFFNGQPGINGYGILLNPFTLPDSNLGILCGGVAYMTSSNTFTSGEWHHVAAVRSAGTWKLYLDGVQLTLTNSGTVPNSPLNSSNIGENTFKGTLDEIRIWNIARTESEIQSAMNQTLIGNETGLVAYWNFDEGVGTTTADMTGNGNDGSINGATWVVSGAALFFATTNSTSIIGVTTATANGTVNAGSASTTVRFLYGTVSGTYTDSIDASQSPVIGSANTPVSAILTGLTANTTYYVRVAASNANGYVRGSELNFTTSSGAGYALQFDGVNDYVMMGNAPAFSVGAAVTYETWINPETTHNGYIFNKWVGFLEDKTFIFSGDRVHFYLFNVFNASFLSSTSTIPLGQFTHVAATYDGSTAKIYINGVLDASKSVNSGASNSSGSFYIGHNAERGDSNNPFRGIMDEYRIWNVARTEAEILSTMNQPLVGNETGLVGYWNYDEGSGTTTADLTSNGNNGTISGATWVASAVALPVELVSFSAELKTQGVELVWKTATETNNYGFEIERKVINNQSSVISWSKVGFVEGNGTTNTTKEYSFSDKNISPGKYSYRLKQIDRDGKFEYSKAVDVTIASAPKEFALEQNYPNPFNPSTMISYQLPVISHVSLKVYDAIGREVAVLVNGVKEGGKYSVEFNASELSSGMYFYILRAKGFSQTKKLLLVK